MGKQKILIIEDEKMIREAITSFLISKGIEVISVDSGSKALQIIKRENITFVVLDLMLPDISGESICKM